MNLWIQKTPINLTSKFCVRQEQVLYATKNDIYIYIYNSDRDSHPPVRVFARSARHQIETRRFAPQGTRRCAPPTRSLCSDEGLTSVNTLLNEWNLYLPAVKITSTITLNTSWFSCKPCTNYLKYPKTTTKYNIKKYNNTIFLISKILSLYVRFTATPTLTKTSSHREWYSIVFCSLFAQTSGKILISSYRSPARWIRYMWHCE